MTYTCKKSKENRVRIGLSSSLEISQGSKLIAALLKGRFRAPEPTLIISFVKKISFQSNIQSRAGACILKLEEPQLSLLSETEVVRWYNMKL